MSSITMVKYATAICDCCGAKIKQKLTHTIYDNEELDETIVNLEKIYWESGSHICDKCRHKFKV